jgi:hypothetical protein
MAEIKKTIDIKVNTNSKEVQKDFNTIRKLIQETEKSIEELSKAEGDNSKEMDKLIKKLGSLNNEYKKLSSTAVDLGASFEDINGEVKPLTAQLGELEDRLYQLALAGKQNTDEFALLTAEAGRYRQAQIQTDLAVDASAKTIGQKLGGALQGAAGAFAIAQGAAGLFGSESEDLNKALLKVQSAMALVSGINAFRDSIPDLKALGGDLGKFNATITNTIARMGFLGKAKKAAAIEARALSTATNQAAVSEATLGTTGTAAGVGIAGGMTAATIATTAFYTVLTGGVALAVMAALSAAAAFFGDMFTSANEKATEAAETAGTKIEAQQDKIRSQYEKTKAKLDSIDLTGGSKKAAYDQLIKDQQAYLDESVKAEENAAEKVRLAKITLQEAIADEDKKEIEEAELKLAELETKRNEANATTIQSQTAVNQAIIDKDRNLFRESNKGLQDQINRKRAAGQSTLALQIEYKQKELEATKKFNIQQAEEEERLNNEIIALQKSLADEQRAAYEKQQGAKKANQQAIASLDIATLENQKATALAAAKTDQERLNIENEYFNKIKKVRIDAINTQAALDKSLVKSSETSNKEKNTIEKNRLAALVAIETETVNTKEKSEETQKKINLDALNQQAAILQEKTKLEGASFQDRINLVLKQQEIELATLEEGSEKYKAVVTRQGEELVKLRKELADKIAAEANKKLVEAQTIGNLDQEIKDSQTLLDLKQKEGETLAQFIQRRNDLEKELSRKRLKDQNDDLQKQLDQTVTYTEDGVEKTRKAIEAGSEEELAIKRKMNENSEELYQEDVQNKLDAEQKKKDDIEKLVNATMAVINEAANFTQAILDAETKRIEEEYAKRAELLQKNLDKRLENEELTESQIAEVQRQAAVEQAKIEEEKQAKLKEIQKKQADIDLGITIANIIANTALAAIKVAGQTGVGAALAVPLVLALGAAQLATAIAQRQAIQGLALGGMVYGAGGPTDDLVPIMASNGEAVINAAAVQKFAPVLSAINESTGGAPIRPKFAIGGVVSATPGNVNVNNIQDIAAVAGQSAVRAYILDADVTSQSVKNARLAREARIK